MSRNSERGWHCFPLGAGTKKPHKGTSGHLEAVFTGDWKDNDNTGSSTRAALVDPEDLPVILGKSQDDDVFFTGQMGSLRIYNWALSVEEIVHDIAHSAEHVHVLREKEDFVKNFIRALGSALDNIEPNSYTQDQTTALLMGIGLVGLAVRRRCGGELRSPPGPHWSRPT